MFPKHAISSVSGIGAMAGAIGGIFVAKLAGVLFDHYKAIGQLTTVYQIIFIICGFAYLLAWLILHTITRERKNG